MFEEGQLGDIEWWWGVSSAQGLRRVREVDLVTRDLIPALVPSINYEIV